MDYGDWSENCRNSYNKWDAISSSTTQVCSIVSIFKFISYMYIDGDLFIAYLPL